MQGLARPMGYSRISVSCFNSTLGYQTIWFLNIRVSFILLYLIIVVMPTRLVVCREQLLLLFLLQKGDAASKLAISDLNSSTVYVYDVASGAEGAHCHPVRPAQQPCGSDALNNAPANTVISSDTKGMWHSSCCHQQSQVTNFIERRVSHWCQWCVSS